MPSATRTRRILILIENLPLQRDARVKRQCRALLDAGYAVTVVCPRSDEVLDADLADVRLRTWKAPPEGSGHVQFLREYLVALIASAALVVRSATREGFDAIQSCNPPDFYFLIAAPFRVLGKPFVFDHHDLTPELFAARFGTSTGPLAWMLAKMERASFATAAHVIATNESIKRVAVERGGQDPADVTVVRNGPVLADTCFRSPVPAYRGGRTHMVCWHGVMGSADDGLDLALQVVADVVHGSGDAAGRDDCHFVFLGDGEERRNVEVLAASLGVKEHVTFPGWSSMEVVHDHLATATIGLVPDPKTPGVDKATVMKVMEYMAFSVPVVAFDVIETRVSAGHAGVYAADNDPRDMARLIRELLDDPARRAEMGRVGRRRIEDGLAWDHQIPHYLSVYDRLLGGKDFDTAALPQSADASVPTAIDVGSDDDSGATHRDGLTSVIVPTHHRPDTLRQTLSSIIAQRTTGALQFEVIVVNDGPDPRTRMVVDALGDPRVRIVEADGVGSAAATRNVGIRHARGAWLAFCDDDDLWAPDKLLALHRALADTGARWACSAAIRVDTDLVPIAHDHIDADQLDLLDVFNVIPGGGSGMLVSADVIDSVGGFDETLTNAEDWDMWVRVGRHASGTVVDSPLIAYRVWDSNKSADLDGVKRSIRRIVMRYGEWPPRDPAGTLWDQYFMTKLSGSRHRRQAAASTMRLARHRRRPKTVVRAVALLAFPETVARRDRNLRRASIPEAWRRDTVSWLAPHATTSPVSRSSTEVMA